MRLALLALLIALLAPAPAQGLASPNVTFIPDKFSPGADFIAIVRGSPDSRMTWIVPEAEGGFGLFPRVGNLSYCYFSDTEPSSNCGPSPFRSLGLSPYEFLLGAVDSEGQLSNSTLMVPLGGIQMFKDIRIDNGTVYFDIDMTGLPTSVGFSVYYQDISLFRGRQELEKNLQTFKWRGETSLPAGKTFYIALTAVSETDFGGELIRITMPGGSPVDIRGNASGLEIIAEPAESRGILLNPGEHWEKTGFRITNIGTGNLTNLSARVSGELSSILEVSLARNYLEPNDTIFYTVKLDNIRSSVTINSLVDILSAGRLAGKIQVSIPVTVMGEIQACPSSGAVSIRPNIWSGDYLLGDIEETFSLANNRNEEITGINYSRSGAVSGIAVVSGPSRLPASGTGTIRITLQPEAAGNYQGVVLAETPSGSEAILVNVNFYEDVSSGLEGLRSEYNGLRGNLSASQLSYLSGLISGIEADLDSAETLAEQENYLEAEKRLAAAQAGINAISSLSGSPSPPGPGPSLDFDLTTIIMIVMAIVIVGAAFLFLKKRKKGIGDDLEEEFQEAMEL